MAEMIINRIIDNASVAIAAINRHSGGFGARHGAGHARRDGATVFGVPPGRRVSPEWAAWANGTAVRELDMHDTFLAADYSHPGDNIPPILAVAQTMERSGRDLIRGIATGYEIQIDLVRAICLHEHKIDHIAHLCPAQAAGIGTLLRLTPRRSTRRCSRRCMSASPRASRAKARSAPGRPTRPRMPASWRSRRSIAHARRRCAEPDL